MEFYAWYNGEEILALCEACKKARQLADAPGFVQSGWDKQVSTYCADCGFAFLPKDEAEDAVRKVRDDLYDAANGYVKAIEDDDLTNANFYAGMMWALAAKLYEANRAADV